ncbi:unnamed protein product [Bursaphelenchus okinawaensis]|uniref:Crossover junction endonuclease MUS81 n=1 Tax=Bursaphelenchus okinawaensis TaxID=465554 RepID=A0A811JTF4_9BILA|nr:unnamed protein product [Bursaphelenchus okinawaensis]CAG9082960.1 unnamed protein product [Bursaphelenchus okinawaensis]
MPPKAVKVNLIYPENHFYEKVLIDWKDNASDKNGAFVVKKALENLKKYPLKINGYADLKMIKGIGEDFATRLDAAYKYFKQVNGVSEVNLSQVRALRSGEFLQFLCESTVSRGKKTIPFLSVDARQNLRMMSKFGGTGLMVGTSQQTKGPSSSQNAASTSKTVLSSICSNVSPLPLPEASGIVGPSGVSTQSSVLQPSFPSQSHNPGNRVPTSSQASTTSHSEATDSQLVYKPYSGILPQVLLVVDNRENRRDGRSNGLCDHLTKKGVQYDLRSLAVGDFLWVLQMGPGHENELVMDFVIERKTWDDLKTSVRQSRYHEQKQRLKQSEIKNIILLVEGSTSKVDSSLEQAIVSTCIQDGFLVQRTLNSADTAQFLRDLTNYLVKRLNSNEISGQSFAAFQDESKKTKVLTVADCFLKQLTVCPGMSSSKAKDVVSRFPSMTALRSLYQTAPPFANREDILKDSVPSVTQSVSKHVSRFFVQ